MEQDEVDRRERLRRTHVPVVHHVVHEVASRAPASLDQTVLDLAGLAALDHAAATYDVVRGVPFATYVRTVVRRALVEELRSYDWSAPAASGPDPARVGLVAEAVAALPERLALVARGYFLEQRPVAEIAAELGVTEARVAELRTEALARLRDRVATAHLVTSVAASA